MKRWRDGHLTGTIGAMGMVDNKARLNSMEDLKKLKLIVEEEKKEQK